MENIRLAQSNNNAPFLVSMLENARKTHSGVSSDFSINITAPKYWSDGGFVSILAKESAVFDIFIEKPVFSKSAKPSIEFGQVVSGITAGGAFWIFRQGDTLPLHRQRIEQQQAINQLLAEPCQQQQRL
jgi:hypothetical protein